MQAFKAVGEKNTTSYFTVERWRVQRYVFLFSKGLVALTLTLRLPPYDSTPLGLLLYDPFPVKISGAAYRAVWVFGSGPHGIQVLSDCRETEIRDPCVAGVISVAASRAGSDGGSEMIDGSVDLSIGSDSSLTDRVHLWDNHQ